MSRTLSSITVVAALATLAAAPMLQASRGQDAGTAQDIHADHVAAFASSLVARVREATAPYRDIEQARNAGYGRFGGCVSGPQAGAMGVHYVNGGLVDGVLDVDHPEALIYEFKGGRARLVGVEYILPAALWNTAHPAGDVPVLEGQLLQFNGAPNRYRLDSFYELHVWAWRDNPMGTFVDWNTRVSCDDAE